MCHNLPLANEQLLAAASSVDRAGYLSIFWIGRIDQQGDPLCFGCQLAQQLHALGYDLIFSCGARAASGHAAAPPSSLMNSRHLMWDTGVSLPSGSEPGSRAVSLPHLRVATSRSLGMCGDTVPKISSQPRPRK